MSFNLNRINPNQTQVIFHDGRFETLTNEELDELLAPLGMNELSEGPDLNMTN